jgi:RNA polymerase sigma-70 factor (ECF subfamily)
LEFDAFDEAWRAALALGNPDALARLYDRLGARLFAMARGVTGSDATAEDAVQQTFLNLHRSRSALARARDVEAYAFRCLRHAAMHLARPYRSVPLEHADEPLVEPAEPVEPDAPLERALAALSSEQREVLALKTEAGLTFEQIGAALGVSPNTAASRYRYALEHLRTALGASR